LIFVINEIFFAKNFKKTILRIPLVDTGAKYFLVFNFLKFLSSFLYDLSQRVFNEGFVYIRGLFLIFFTDALIADDEPL